MKILKAFGFGLGLFFPAYLANRYFVSNEKRKQKEFNHNNLILLESELIVIHDINKKIRQTCEILIDVCKNEGKLVLSRLPHTIPFGTLESILSNLLLFPNQDGEILKGLIELKANLVNTNEGLDFYSLQDLLRKTPDETKGTSIEEYFFKIFEYLNYTDELIHGLQLKIVEIKSLL